IPRRPSKVCVVSLALPSAAGLDCRRSGRNWGRPSSRADITRMKSVRRSDFDVTNSVQVSSPQAVLAEVKTLFAPTWPTVSFEPLDRAFLHFERLFAGDVPGYCGVDTVYHDRQHTLDITLALARLIVGYERQHEEPERLGGERAV